MPSITPPLKGTNAPVQAQSSVEDRLKELQLARLEREEAELQVRQERRVAQARRQAQDAARTEENRRIVESMCTHKMPNGESAFGGQWCSDGKLHVVCGICGKNCTADDLAPHEKPLVMANMGRFGGSMSFNMSI